MSSNWYKSKSSGKAKRDPIVLGENETFSWEGTNKIDNSYSIISIKLGSKNHNFYMWSQKTIKSAKKLYDDDNHQQSLKMLKKYAFDVSSI
jgi:hypothetical protein